MDEIELVGVLSKSCIPHDVNKTLTNQAAHVGATALFRWPDTVPLVCHKNGNRNRQTCERGFVNMG